MISTIDTKTLSDALKVPETKIIQQARRMLTKLKIKPKYQINEDGTHLLLDVVETMILTDKFYPEYDDEDETISLIFSHFNPKDDLDESTACKNIAADVIKRTTRS